MSVLMEMPINKCCRHIFINKLNPFAPGDLAEERVLKLVKRFSGHCRAMKS